MLTFTDKIMIYDLVPQVMKWPRHHQTIVNGRYVEEVVIWRVEKFPATVRYGASNDN